MRNKIYADSANEQSRNNIRRSVEAELERSWSKYKISVSGDEHCKNIVSLAKTISCKHSPDLASGRFRIGTAQKALNLCLKYIWCLDEVKTPPHFPVDSIMIRKISDVYGEFKNVPWTKIDCIELYKLLVKKAGTISKEENLATWELKEYQEVRKLKKQMR